MLKIVNVEWKTKFYIVPKYISTKYALISKGIKSAFALEYVMGIPVMKFPPLVGHLPRSALQQGSVTAQHRFCDLQARNARPQSNDKKHKCIKTDWRV